MKESIFRVNKKDSHTNARTGVLRLPHGEVRTPVFMPVATKGTVKTLLPQEVEALGYEMILSNTYHIFEKPGLKEIEKFGGLHSYIGWKRPILTDSGGYQVFSLGKHSKVLEDGVEFRSLIDGKKIIATPESVLEWQLKLGSDIAMVLDVCTPFGISYEETRTALEITLQWAERSIKYWKGIHTDNLIFGIVQGGFYEELRRKAAREMAGLDFDGYAAGGLSVGEPKEVMYTMSEAVALELPEEKPRYFMGLGDPVSILTAISQGYDMFDSALPTRIARGGSFLTEEGSRNIRNSIFKGSRSPLSENCSCTACKNFTSGFIRHLYLSEETLALRLLTIHNLNFMKELIEKARNKIEEGGFLDYLNEFREKFNSFF
jgi:queuine tRNA-ribosyltransferase